MEDPGLARELREETLRECGLEFPPLRRLVFFLLNFPTPPPPPLRFDFWLPLLGDDALCCCAIN